ncbi:hypothetical protein [Streptomyces sp. HNM0574]|uniref:hypothetical protein n=1 Tax=Streptomyces sp. HNM0574 TaxID=2714954 RepID=UPI00146BD95E|nr:hypothetical protein [Streptomyces sp. HNM0574]NLU68878.1 hypothetical protein [Streptomyces sp. HNM0574]
MSDNDTATGGGSGGSSKLFPFTALVALGRVLTSLVQIAWYRLGMRRSRKSLDKG